MHSHESPETKPFLTPDEMEKCIEAYAKKALAIGTSIQVKESPGLEPPTDEFYTDFGGIPKARATLNREAQGAPGPIWQTNSQSRIVEENYALFKPMGIWLPNKEKSLPFEFVNMPPEDLLSKDANNKLFQRLDQRYALYHAEDSPSRYHCWLLTFMLYAEALLKQLLEARGEIFCTDTASDSQRRSIKSFGANIEISETDFVEIMSQLLSHPAYKKMEILYTIDMSRDLLHLLYKLLAEQCIREGETSIIMTEVQFFQAVSYFFLPTMPDNFHTLGEDIQRITNVLKASPVLEDVFWGGLIGLAAENIVANGMRIGSTLAFISEPTMRFSPSGINKRLTILGLDLRIAVSKSNIKRITDQISLGILREEYSKEFNFDRQLMQAVDKLSTTDRPIKTELIPQTERKIPANNLSELKKQPNIRLEENHPTDKIYDVRGRPGGHEKGLNKEGLFLHYTTDRIALKELCIRLGKAINKPELASTVQALLIKDLQPHVMSYLNGKKPHLTSSARTYSLLEEKAQDDLLSSSLNKKRLAIQRQKEKSQLIMEMVGIVERHYSDTRVLNENIYFVNSDAIELKFLNKKNAASYDETAPHYVVVLSAYRILRFNPQEKLSEELKLTDRGRLSLIALGRGLKKRPGYEQSLKSLEFNSDPGALQVIKKIITDILSKEQDKFLWHNEPLSTELARLIFPLSSIITNVATEHDLKSHLSEAPRNIESKNETVPTPILKGLREAQKKQILANLLPRYHKIIEEEVAEEQQRRKDPAFILETKKIEDELNSLIATQELKDFQQEIHNENNKLREMVGKLETEFLKGNVACHVSQEQFRNNIAFRFLDSELHPLLTNLGGAIFMAPPTVKAEGLSTTDVLHNEQLQHFSVMIMLSKGRQCAGIYVKDWEKLTAAEIRNGVSPYFLVASVHGIDPENYQILFKEFMCEISANVGEVKADFKTTSGHAVSGVNLSDAREALREALTKYHAIPLASNIKSPGVLISVMQEEDFADVIVGHIPLHESSHTDLAFYKGKLQNDPTSYRTIANGFVRHSGDVVLAEEKPNFSIPSICKPPYVKLAQYITIDFRKAPHPFCIATFTSAWGQASNGEYAILSAKRREIYETLLAERDLDLIQAGIAAQDDKDNMAVLNPMLAMNLSNALIKLPEGIRGKTNTVRNLASGYEEKAIPPLAKLAEFSNLENARATAYAMSGYLSTPNGIVRVTLGQVVPQAMQAVNTAGYQTARNMTASLLHYLRKSYNQEYFSMVAAQGISSTDNASNISHKEISNLFVSFPTLLAKFLEDPTNTAAATAYKERYNIIKRYSPGIVDFTECPSFMLFVLRHTNILKNDPLREAKIKIIFLTHKLHTLTNGLDAIGIQEQQTLANQTIIFRENRRRQENERVALVNTYALFAKRTRDSDIVFTFPDSHGTPAMSPYINRTSRT